MAALRAPSLRYAPPSAAAPCRQRHVTLRRAAAADTSPFDAAPKRVDEYYAAAARA